MTRNLNERVAALPEDRRARVEARAAALIDEELAQADRDARPAALEEAVARARAWTRKLAATRPGMSVEGFLAEKRSDAARE